MRKVGLGDSINGSILARTIFTLDNDVLLTAGTVLTSRVIKKLLDYGITEVYIEDEMSQGIAVPETIKEEILTMVKSQVKAMMTLPEIKTSVDVNKVTELIEKLLTEILKSDDVIINLSDIRSIDDYTFSHSVNVSIFSLITGITLDFSRESLKDLGIGSLLHDVGKVMIDKKLLDKPSVLTLSEYEEVKRHTFYGYDILRNSPGIGPMAHSIALYHHERVDGSGYPYSLKGRDIPLAARITAVADVYDALTTTRSYRKGMHPSHVIDYMYSLSDKHFDSRILKAFFQHIANYPIGTGVILNTGEKGIISEYNHVMPNRPVVRILFDAKGNKLSRYIERDLSRKPECRIVDVWDF
ncbi:MAG: HD-GYP domain-containing protein [Clostridiaceae bacterium]|nr:HD-GYP domain-containing protein [Clostridiaceae bacterium]